MKCYGTLVYQTYPKGCATNEPSPFSLPLSSNSIFYSGSNLPYTGIQTEDTLTEALQKIDENLNPEAIVNSLIAEINTNPALKSALCAAISDCS